MTPAREAFVLPALLLTVTLLGGLRIAGQVRLVPPPLLALVLGLLLVGTLARARVLAPERLMHQQRTGLENLSGLVVLLTLLAASAQIFNLLIPEGGVLYALFSAFFLVQLFTTLAAVDERIPLLRSLAVLFGGAFVLRFVVLESVYAPDGGRLARVVTALMEGVTLGALGYTAHAPATGYVAFVTVVLYMIALVMLSGPGGPPSRPGGLPMRAPGREILLVCLLLGACGGAAAPARAGAGNGSAASLERAAALREDALASARVWRSPEVPIASAPLGDNPPGSEAISAREPLRCRFVLEPVGGTTPKFNCELPGGEVVKIKYGEANQETYTEVAATRLVRALGFGADLMYVVPEVQCAGCPAYPFQALRCHERTGFNWPCLSGGLSAGTTVIPHGVVERRPAGRRIEAYEDQGWAWYELDRIDETEGGSTLAELDALRLLAVVLAHWDNKAANQRLVCLPGGDRSDGSCATPVALMQDLGGTFGPVKLDLRNWRRTPVWADAAACRVSMKRLPFAGATFPDWTISEAGRRFLLTLLAQLSREQLIDLFTGARFPTFEAVHAESRSAEAWARAFEDKVEQIRKGGPCPAAGAVTASRGR